MSRTLSSSISSGIVVFLVVVKIHLETERLMLREFTDNDAALLGELEQDPDVMLYINGGADTPMSEIVTHTLPIFLAYHKIGSEYGYWAAIDKRDGAFIGWFQFRLAPVGDDIEIGYCLKKSAWGKGYATEGCRTLINHGFTRLGVRRVVATVVDGNVASIRVLIKSGLRFDSFVQEPRCGGLSARRFVMDASDFDQLSHIAQTNDT